MFSWNLAHLGTKVMCREGGCGCCVVSVTRNDLSTGKDVIIAVNSVSTPSVRYKIVREMLDLQ